MTMLTLNLDADTHLMLQESAGKVGLAEDEFLIQLIHHHRVFVTKPASTSEDDKAAPLDTQKGPTPVSFTTDWATKCQKC